MLNEIKEYQNLINIFYLPGRALFISAPMLDVPEMIEALFEPKDSQKNFEGINSKQKESGQSAACSCSIPIYDVWHKKNEMIRSWERCRLHWELIEHTYKSIYSRMLYI
jgi:hypothetical protein